MLSLQSMLDLAGLYRIWNPKYNTWSVFGQDHLAKVLLSWDTTGQNHDAVLDAMKSMRLFNLHVFFQSNPAAWTDAQAGPPSSSALPALCLAAGDTAARAGIV